MCLMFAFWTSVLDCAYFASSHPLSPRLDPPYGVTIDVKPVTGMKNAKIHLLMGAPTPASMAWLAPVLLVCVPFQDPFG